VGPGFPKVGCILFLRASPGPANTAKTPRFVLP
jgi:hypothetical protein